MDDLSPSFVDGHSCICFIDVAKRFMCHDDGKSLVKNDGKLLLRIAQVFYLPMCGGFSVIFI